MNMEKLAQEAKVILDQFPKAKQKLLQWELGVLKKSQQEMVKSLEGEEVSIPEIDPQDVEAFVAVNFSLNPHFVFLFLDENNTFVSILRGTSGFTYRVNDGDISDNFSSRLAAEMQGATEGLKILEGKL